MNFMENMGAAFLTISVVAAIVLVGLFLEDNTNNTNCELEGYATEIQLRGERYCVSFEDGIIKKVGIPSMDDGKYVIEQEFVLVGGD